MLPSYLFSRFTSRFFKNRGSPLTQRKNETSAFYKFVLSPIDSMKMLFIKHSPLVKYHSNVAPNFHFVYDEKTIRAPLRAAHGWFVKSW